MYLHVICATHIDRVYYKR